MGFVSTDDGVIGVVSKLANEDEGAAKELLRYALYETLCDEVDLVRDAFDADASAFISKRSDDARRALVRKYIERRIEGEEVEDLIQAGAYLTLVEKAAADDPSTPYWDARGQGGRFVRAMDALRTFSESESTRAQARALGTKQENRAEAGLRSFAEDDRYGRARRVGAALNLAEDPRARAVGVAADLYGTFGAEAERVLKPGLTRTAYRYRGTERTPDASVRRQVKNVDAASAGKFAEDAEFRQQISAMVESGREVAPHMGALAFYANDRDSKNLTGDQIAMRVRGDVAVNYLRDKLPSPRQTALSQRAGRTPPSQGVIIDADGDLVTEAMGYNGDHYLPFDLKNLKRLNGGQYVRTRAAGGPTSEDIYTGLLSNARQMQVVSNSGVFTVEFDPDLRGGRRYSDKARQMIRRYDSLLQTVKTASQGKGTDALMAADISAEEKRTLRRQALEEANFNRDDARSIYSDLLEERRAEREADIFDEDELEDIARERVTEAMRRAQQPTKGANFESAVRDKTQELLAQNQENRVKRYQLDGEGFYNALLSLQQEFPYYIRDVRFETQPDFLKRRKMLRPTEGNPRRFSGTDQGLLRHGATSAESAGAKTETKTEESTGTGAGAGGGSVGFGAAGASGGTGAARVGGSARTALPGLRINMPRTLEEVPTLAQAAGNNTLIDQAAGSLETVHRTGFHGLEPSAQAMKGNPDDEGLARESAEPQDYIAWVKARAQAGDDPRKVLRWLANEATPEQVNTYASKLSSMADNMDSEFDIDEGKRKAFREAADRVRRVVAMRDPFGKEAGENFALVRPEGKPLAFPEVVKLGTSMKNHNEFAQAQDEKMRSVIADYARLGPDAAADLRQRINEYEAAKQWAGRGPQPAEVKNYTDRDARMIAAGGKPDALADLGRRQIALSYLESRRAAEAYNKAMGVDPGKAPAAPAAASRQPVSAWDPPQQSAVSGVVSQRDWTHPLPSELRAPSRLSPTRSRPASTPSLSDAPLAVTLAKRLLEDPEYLARLVESGSGTELLSRWQMP